MNIDGPTASVIVALVTLAGTLYNGSRIASVHTLVNSNFSEAKAARLAAEAALKVSQELNVRLQLQLDSANARVVDHSGQPIIVESKK